MIPDLDRVLQAYGELTVRVGLNLQPGQRLLIIGPLANGGASLEAAPLIREIVASAYRAGAPFVEVLWGDESLLLSRFRLAPRDSFGEISSWLPGMLVQHVDAGHAVLSVSANDPDLLKDQPVDLVGAMQQASARGARAFRERISRNHTNWSVVAAPSDAWAARVFPDCPADQRISRLWEAIIRLCRLDQPDPVAAWNAHVEALATRSRHLNARQYTALKYTGPGTDLTIGLPPGHVWISARTANAAGVPFTANLPTEEVFTMPHRDRVDGTVRSSKPLSYAGNMVERFSLTFSGGRVVDVSAERGEAVLRQLIETDEGARRLGELALVPHGSPISQSGVLFYNTLFDENAASHLALGSAYKFTMAGGDQMSEADFERAGGNQSASHVDFMIGSGELDVNGVLANGTTEPVMRKGEWAF